MWIFLVIFFSVLTLWGLFEGALLSFGGEAFGAGEKGLGGEGMKGVMFVDCCDRVGRKSKDGGRKHIGMCVHTKVTFFADTRCLWFPYLHT